jgi:hypothetical protein
MHLPAAQSLFVATYTVDGASLTSRGHQVAADVASGRIPRSVLLKPETEQHVPALHQQVLDLLAGSCPARYARPEAGRLAGQPQSGPQTPGVATTSPRSSTSARHAQRASLSRTSEHARSWAAKAAGISLPARWSGPT